MDYYIYCSNLLLLLLKKCESNSGSEAINSSINKIQPQTKKNKANYTLSGSILSEKEETAIKLNAYKIEIAQKLKIEIDKKINFFDCEIESPISWKFRFYTKDGSIENNKFIFSNKSEDTEDRRSCLESKLNGIKIPLKNKLEIPYIRMEIGIE